MSIDVLQEAIRKTKNPTMVSLDPTPELLPDCVLQAAFSDFGQTPQGLSKAYYTFCRNILDQLQGVVPAIKLQAACFEILGSCGTAVLQELCTLARDRGFYVVLDSMRGELPHIASIYAEAIFDKVKIGARTYEPFPCDGLTLNGYLGSDAVKPFLPYCKDGGKNVFLLVRTPNRSAREVQDLISGDRVVHTAMADLAMRWSTDLFGKCGYSQIGAVMGATDPQTLSVMRQKYDRLFFLVEGYGAQGGTAKNVAGAFDQLGHGAVVTASRSILGAWKRQETDGQDYAQQALKSAEKMKKDIEKYVMVI